MEFLWNCMVRNWIENCDCLKIIDMWWMIWEYWVMLRFELMLWQCFCWNWIWEIVQNKLLPCQLFFWFLWEFESISNNFKIWKVPMAPKHSRTSSNYDAASSCQQQHLTIMSIPYWRRYRLERGGSVYEEETSPCRSGNTPARLDRVLQATTSCHPSLGVWVLSKCLWAPRECGTSEREVNGFW